MVGQVGLSAGACRVISGVEVHLQRRFLAATNAACWLCRSSSFAVCLSCTLATALAPPGAQGRLNLPTLPRLMAVAEMLLALSPIALSRSMQDIAAYCDWAMPEDPIREAQPAAEAMAASSAAVLAIRSPEWCLAVFSSAMSSSLHPRPLQSRGCAKVILIKLPHQRGAAP